MKLNNLPEPTKVSDQCGIKKIQGKIEGHFFFYSGMLYMFLFI
jgi:hypothetical protein